MIRKILLISLGFSVFASAQKIENAENLAPFFDKLNKNESVTNVLFIGDSHIQSGHISEYLRKKFFTRILENNSVKKRKILNNFRKIY